MQLALPCAVSKTGILVGGLLFGLVAALTFASCSIIVRCAELVPLLACLPGLPGRPPSCLPA